MTDILFFAIIVLMGHTLFTLYRDVTSQLEGNDHDKLDKQTVSNRRKWIR